MTEVLRVFGMHKAGTSFLMKALSHFCHQNSVALVSVSTGMLPMAAYGDFPRAMDRAGVETILSLSPEQKQKWLEFGQADYPEVESFSELLGTLIRAVRVTSTGDETSRGRIHFYRNSSRKVYELEPAVPSVRVIRNPMSIVKSAYFSHKVTHSIHNWGRLGRQRDLLNSLSQEEGLRRTYDFLCEECFSYFSEGPLWTLANWPADTGGPAVVKMEDITSSPTSFLLSLWKQLGGDLQSMTFVPPQMLSFEYQSGGRKPGEVDEKSHLRSGNQDEWRALLPPDLVRTIRRDFGDLLEKFYPASLEDGPAEASSPYTSCLLELEQAYQALFESRASERSSAAAALSHEKMFDAMKGQRDKASADWSARFEDMKTQRDRILAEGTRRFEDMKSQRDKLLASLPRK